MDFTFTEDQQLLADSVATFLHREVTPERIRASWEGEGSDTRLWQQLVELGLPAMLVPEDHGGLGMNELDFIQIAQECGRVALAEPLVEMAMIATPMLAQLAAGSQPCARVLQQIAAGEARVAIGHPLNPAVADAGIADWLLLASGREVHLVPSDAATLIRQDSVDPSRRLYTPEWDRTAPTYRVAGEEAGAAAWCAALNRGAVLNAALLLGLAQGMVAQSVTYAGDREQFGRPIGANQAVKHHMANCAVQAEFARSPIYRAAYAVAQDPARAHIAASHAKLAAGEAALLAAKNAIQVHGAMGYTWECNLHIWAKRAWALEKNWGDAGFHQERLHAWLLEDTTDIGAEHTFDYPAPEALDSAA